MKIVSIVGKKNTGKTSLSVKVIEELTRRGHNVASIKHSHHTMEMDKENTDTWKHKQAGSKVVVGIGSTTFFNVRREMDLNRLLFLIKYMDDIDFVVIEGFKRYNYPKIITSPNVRDEYTIKEVDSFTIDQKGIEELADLIEQRGHDIVDTLFAANCGFNNGEAIAGEIRKGNLKEEDIDDVESYMSIDGHVIGLNRFVSDFLKKTILGVVSTLNLDDYGVEKIENIELLIPGENQIQKDNSKATVLINDAHLEINEFTNDIVANSIKGLISSLKTEDNIKTIDIEISEIKNDTVVDSGITLKTNGNNVKINEFTCGILKETIFGIINTLKIDDEIENIKIKVEE